MVSRSNKLNNISIVKEPRVPVTRFDLETALNGVVSEQSKRHWRTLTQELGDRKLKVSDLADLGVHSQDIIDLLASDDDYITLSELVVLGQYKEAIVTGNTKAATFLRDTAGYKPATDVTVEQKRDGLAAMSDEELRELLKAVQASTENEGNTDDQRK